MNFDDFGGILYFEDVRLLLGISKSTLLKLLRNGSIPAFKVGKQWRFNKDEHKNRTQVNAMFTCVLLS